MNFKTYWIIEVDATCINDAREKIRKIYDRIKCIELRLDERIHSHSWIDKEDLK